MTKQLGDGEERGQHELLVHLEWINSFEYLLKMVSAQVVVQVLKKCQRGAGKSPLRILDAQIPATKTLITP